jgi:hypothetical protein
MYFNTILGLFLAALAAAAPSHHAHHHHKRGLVTFIMTEPDCDSLRDYCKNCSNEFVSPPPSPFFFHSLFSQPFPSIFLISLLRASSSNPPFIHPLCPLPTTYCHDLPHVPPPFFAHLESRSRNSMYCYCASASIPRALHSSLYSKKREKE